MPHSTGLCYGSISLFSTILHNIFILYHVDMFLSAFKIDKTSFWIGESLFLIWNSVNDPLFGWIGDSGHLTPTDNEEHKSEFSNSYITDSSLHRRYNRHGEIDNSNETFLKGRTANAGASPSAIIRRTNMIRYCGPMLALCFCLIWFDWLIPSVQFPICLCLYDAFLTMVDLQQSALLAELSITLDSRTSLNSYDSVFSAIGSLSVFLSYYFWDKNDLGYFRIFCITLAMISAVGYYVVTSILQSKFIQVQHTARQNVANESHCSLSNLIKSFGSSSRRPMRLFFRQMLSHKNFLVFTVINIIQVFHCHFNSNFFPMFMESLVKDHKHYGSFLIGISFVMPHINNLLFLKMCKYYGLYAVIKLLFCIKLMLALAMWGAGPSFGWLMCFFIGSNRVFTEGTCKLLTLVISDLVDEDYVRNGRTEPVSALIFGTANFLAKPGQTLAPIIGTSLISYMTGHDLFAKSPRDESTVTDDLYRNACFQMLVYVPLVCGALQVMVWSFYKLHGTTLQRIKSARSNSNFNLLMSV